MDVRSRNHVRVSGRPGGPVVMLAHGFGCDQNLWRLVVPALEREFTVVLFDHVGAGRSDLSAWSEDRYSSMDGYVDDVLEICRELDLGPVTFVGHSVSATMGVLAAARHPEYFAGLVLLAPSPCFIDDPAAGYRGGFSAEDIEELLQSLDANYLAGRGRWHRSSWQPRSPGTGAGADQQLLRHRPGHRQGLCPCDVPVRQPHRPGAGDGAHPGRPVLQRRHRPTGGRCLRPRPDQGSRLITLNATGHCPQLSAPEETAQAIAAFAGRLR